MRAGRMAGGVTAAAVPAGTLAAAAALAVALAPSAAAWQEGPFRPIPGRGTATCLRATGPEGGLAALGPLGQRSAPADLLAAAPVRPAVRARVRFPVVLECPAVKEAGAAAVAAAPVLRAGAAQR